jgi:hypothetical protein
MEDNTADKWCILAKTFSSQAWPHSHRWSREMWLVNRVCRRKEEGKGGELETAAILLWMSLLWTQTLLSESFTVNGHLLIGISSVLSTHKVTHFGTFQTQRCQYFCNHNATCKICMIFHQVVLLLSIKSIAGPGHV